MRIYQIECAGRKGGTSDEFHVDDQNGLHNPLFFSCFFFGHSNPTPVARDLQNFEEKKK